MADECVINVGVCPDSDVAVNLRQEDANGNQEINIKIEYKGEDEANSHSPPSPSPPPLENETPNGRNIQENVKPFRLYFKDNDTNAFSNEIKFECSVEYQKPVEVDTAKRFTNWTGSTAGLTPGLYSIVLGVSIDKLDESSLESVSFSHRSSPGKSGYIEVMTRVALIQIVVDMEVRIHQSSKVHPGFIHLHFMELHPFYLIGADPSLNIHRPYLWSINVGSNENSTNPHAPNRPASIRYYSLSGDGSYAATLSGKDKELQLDIWDLKTDASVTDNYNGKSPSTTDLSKPTIPSEPFHPRQVGQIKLQLLKAILPDSDNIMMSLSWDASKVAVVAKNDQYLKDSVSVFSFDKRTRYPVDRKFANALTPYDASRLDLKLRNFSGYGRFHVTNDNNPNPKDQLFITYNKSLVDIYSAHEQWTHLRTITDISMAATPRKVLYSTLGRYFSWTSEQGLVHTYDLETGQIVNAMTVATPAVRFSRDGSRIAIRHPGNTISTLWTGSVTPLGIVNDCSGVPTFIQNDTKLIVDIVLEDEAYGRGRQGVIVDSSNMSVVNRISAKISEYEQQLFSSGSNCRDIVTCNGSKLDLVRLEDVTIQRYTHPRYSCGGHCFNELSRLREIDAISIVAGDDQFCSNTGLKFRVELYEAGGSSRLGSDRVYSLTVWVSDNEGKSREALVVPPLELGDILGHWLEYRVIFNPVTQQMIVLCEILLMVWSLPTTLEGDFTLLVTAWTQSDLYQIEERNDWLTTKLSQCTHGQSYLSLLTMDHSEDIVVDMSRLHYENVFMEEPHSSLEGSLALVEIFEDSSDAFKKAVLQYIGRYVNCYSNPNDLSENVIARICRNVTQKNNAKYARFLTALFESPHGRWVPRRDYSEKSNPISILLELTKNIPRAIDVAHVIINYCIRKANAEKDPQFVLILMEPLQGLISRKQLHTDVSLGALRNLAFIPINEGGFVIDRSKIAHLPESWWWFWANNKPPLYECENPVWQLDRRPLSKPRDPLNDSFNRDIFVASFDMLWRSPKEEPDTRAVVERITNSTRMPQSWIRAMISIVLHKCKLAPEVGVVCHDFSLEFLDNPAIEALIEYKCPARDSLVGIFITIITLATVFLWLEVIQARHNPGRSPYNYVDLIVFALPLVGSCLQISNIANKQQGNTATLSFSVLFIFLHFLFELRINRSVCHFVTIVVRIIGKIRIFFFIFIAGLLAFTIAILHLLRACAVGDCDTSQVGFPSQFYSAFSATYFFMGGIWDPISDNFNSDDWVFHTMMITYFFFTTILLLNVLIALINVAFSTGDETWLSVWTENRLRYVESAESLTYNIPGFRDAHDWFPKEIYYSATLQEVKDYHEKYFKKSDQDSIRSNALTQTIFGITPPPKKVTATSIAKNNPYFWVSSPSLSPAPTCDASRSDDSQRQSDLQQRQQQAIQELKSELIKVQEKTDKRVEDLQTQLAEMKRMLSLLCKEESAKVYVGNLSWSFTDDTLHKAFSEYGQVLDSIVARDRNTNSYCRSRGFGFAIFSNSNETDAAVCGHSEQEIDGFRIKVNLAVARPSSGGGESYQSY
ncbi:hypothetical protein BGX21_009703 [Mortierella sp. AD011]|nr:hypothetical protein BGX21_009703 [Mortierella sp. AD011]